MVRWIVGASLRFRRLVIAVAIGLMAFGFVQVHSAPVAAFPEFMPTTVQVQTEALGLSAEEVEQLITNPLEQEFFNGLPWLADMRSRSLPGLSSIELIFEPGTDIMQARQVVQEKLTMVPALPAAASRPPFVIQPVSSTNRVMMIGLSSSEVSLIDMSVLARWKIKPHLMGLPGVANVSVWGFRDRQLQILVDPERLNANGVSLDQIIRTAGNSMWVSPLTFVEASTPGMGGFIDTPNQRIEIQHNQPIKTASDLAEVTVQGAELTIGDVAEVVEDHQLLIGDAVVQDAPSLMLVVERFPGTGVTEVTRQVEEALQAMGPGLAGIDVDTTVYRPATFVEDMTSTVGIALLIGFVLLVLALLIFLLDWRAALTSTVAILAALAAALLLLTAFGTVLNMMILAGLIMAVVIVVDDAVVQVDNIKHRLRERQLDDQSEESLVATVWQACREMATPLFIATTIIAVSLVPVLLLDGVTGAMLRPLAVSYALAIAASLLVAVTLTPALGMFLLPGGSRTESVFGRALKGAYSAVVGRLIRRPLAASIIAAVILIAGVAAVPVLHRPSMVPSLQQRDLLVLWEGTPGMSRPAMNRVLTAAGQELREIPGVRNVGGQVGRAETSDQTVNVNVAELWISLDPAADYHATTRAAQDVINGYPGLRRELLTYAGHRLRAAETRAEEDLVVRIYGRDYAVLKAKAAEVAELLSGVDGAINPRVKLPKEEPTVEIEVLIAEATRHGLKPGDVRRAAATLVSGITAGSLFEQQKVFDVVVWSVPEKRHSLTDIRDLLIDTPSGEQVRLGDVAEVRIRPNPNVIEHHSVSRNIDVVADISGRGIGAVTGEVRELVQSVSFPYEHHLEVLGDAQARQSEQLKLTMYVIAAVVMIYFLLQAAFASWRLALLSLVLLPVTLAGGVVAALQREYLSVAALLGLLVVLALAARWGVALVRNWQRLEQESGVRDPKLVLQGSAERLVPALLTVLVVVLALIPLVFFGHVAGLEIVRPMAIVIIGGLITAFGVNLFLMPALYLRFAPHSSHLSLSSPSEGKDVTQ